MEWLPDSQEVSAIFALVGMLITIILMFRTDIKLSVQLLGSILVVSICFFASSIWVSLIAVFVVATLVTELQFLEKIAALIWNRKEYWAYLLGKATKNEVEEKTKEDIEYEIQIDEIDGPNEAEAIDESDDEPEGITAIEEDSPIQDKHELITTALHFENQVFDNLNKNSIPFKYKNVEKEVSITSGYSRIVIDGIIKTTSVHFLIEVKYTNRLSSLINAVKQIELYKLSYENYLRERKIRVSVQPLIIVPETFSVSGNFRGIPVVKFDSSNNTFSNLKASYPDYQLNSISEPQADQLAVLLIKFLKRYSKWAFSPLRIKKWGARQAGYQNFDLYSTKEIRVRLEELLQAGVLEERTSKKGNKIYRIKL